MRIVLGLAAVMLWATPAMATDWFFVGTSGRTALFVDRDSIADAGGNLRRAKVYQVFSATDDDGTAAYEPSLEYDCSASRYRFISIKSLDIDGKIMRDDAGTGSWRPIEPGSLDDSGRQFVCSGGTEPSWAKSYGAGPLIEPGRALFEESSEP